MKILRSQIPPTWQILLLLLAVITFYGVANAAELTLNWRDNSSNEDGFKIERRQGLTGTFSQLTTVGVNVSSYVNTGLPNSATYCYRVRAFNGVGDSTYSNETCGTTSPTINLLTVTKSGSGSGTVSSSITGIECGLDCTESYPTGTSVTLTVIPAADSVFSSWSGACTGTGPCTLSLDSDQLVTASFNLKSFGLTVSKIGNGTVTSSPAGIDCGVSCSASYPSGTLVTLTAVPSVDSMFAAWSGACSGTGTCTVTLDAAQSVTATFNLKTYVLTVTTVSELTQDGTGMGTVTSNPIGIDCGVDCTENYPSGTTVTLTALPVSDSVFSGWNGACSGSGTCSVMLDASRSVTATFTGGIFFTISVAMTGSGHIQSDPAGIDCGPNCSERYPTGTSLTLSATPTLDSTFLGWNGACTGTGNCTVILSNDILVAANFTQQVVSRIGVFRPSTGEYLFDINGNGLWDGCEVDTCFTPPHEETNSNNKPGKSQGKTKQEKEQPVIGGNWNFKATAMIGSFDPNSGRWHLDDGNNQWDGCEVDTCIESFGQPGDLPVTGDWDGTETVKIGLFRPNTGEWLLDLNGNSLWDGCEVDRCFGPFGQDGDLPVVGKW